MAAARIESDDVADMLRDSLRGLLEAHWHADCMKDGASPDAITRVWDKLAQQGVAVLGADPEEGGLREILAVMEELGRAACPAPMWSAVLANLVLSDALK